MKGMHQWQILEQIIENKSRHQQMIYEAHNMAIDTIDLPHHNTAHTGSVIKLWTINYEMERNLRAAAATQYTT